MGCTALFAFPPEAIVQPHNPFHHSQVFVCHGPVKQLVDHGLLQEPGIQISGRQAARCAMIGGINVIGAHLEGLDFIAPLAQDRHNPCRYCGLPHAAMSAGNDQSLHVLPLEAAGVSIAILRQGLAQEKVEGFAFRLFSCCYLNPEGLFDAGLIEHLFHLPEGQTFSGFK